ncbi:MAG: hypothetical protein Q9N67_07860 [Ghiorsea sp.]|nr:hypothetical protein [Ghiorsea sp.]
MSNKSSAKVRLTTLAAPLIKAYQGEFFMPEIPFHEAATTISEQIEKNEPNSAWIERLNERMKSSDIELSRLGFDDAWVSDAFWGSETEGDNHV